MASSPYKRILLKISGEMLMGPHNFGISHTACKELAAALLFWQKSGLELAIVIGGGNIFRGIALEKSGVPRSAADQMGMVSTLLNGIALKQAIQELGGKATLMSALECPRVAENYNWEKALEAITSGHLLIFVGGTGNPYFTTDTAAALRALEIEADLLAKATKVDGIYDKDPLKSPNAVKFETITYSEALSEQLQVMDSTAIALCQSNKLPIFVFNMQELLIATETGKRLFDPKRGSFVREH